jgi:hypothetical protein
MTGIGSKSWTTEIASAWCSYKNQWLLWQKIEKSYLSDYRNH